MKKFIVVIAIAIFGLSFGQETGFKAGAHVGLPMGDASDWSSFNAGLDVGYTFLKNDKFSFGAASGYTMYFGKTETIAGIEFDYDDAGFIPLALSGNLSLGENFFLGADLGYAIYVGSGSSDGGFYYQPKLGYKTELMEVYGAYKGISNDGSISSIGLGFNYNF